MSNTNEPCPYCGGDESLCNFDWRTEQCTGMVLRPKAIVGRSLLRPVSKVTLPDDPAERVKITREGADIMNRLKEPKTVEHKR